MRSVKLVDFQVWFSCNNCKHRRCRRKISEMGILRL